MPRIFASLAVAQFFLLLFTGGVGLLHLDLLADRHVLLGVMTILLSCLIQVGLLTFLTVAGKTIAQAVHLGGLPIAPIERVKEIKKKVLLGLACVVVANLAAVATGAYGWREGQRGSLHWVAAAIAVCTHGAVYYRQYSYVCAGSALLDQVISSYRERGPSGEAARRS